MMRRNVALAGLLLVAFAPAAMALPKGSSMFGVELTQGTADFADKLSGSTSAGPSFTAEYLNPYDHSEMGVQGQYWYMLAEDCALAISGEIGFFSEANEPGQGAAANAPDRKFSTSSFNLRLGADRVVKIGERALVYFGPGIEFWSGKAKYENITNIAATYENENTTRIGLSTRIGGTKMMGEYFGVTGHVGGRFGRASVEEQGAKATWWPSSVESSMGLVYTFGSE